MNNTNIIKTATMIKQGLIEKTLTNIKSVSGMPSLLDLDIEMATTNLNWVYNSLQRPSLEADLKERTGVFLTVHSSLFDPDSDTLTKEEKEAIIDAVVGIFESTYGEDLACIS